jgi:signal transduction histidine kinase
MVTALSLYCDLLEEPGVLASAHHHYASELRLVAEGCRRLVEKLSLIDIGQEEAPGNISSRQGRLFSAVAATQTHGGLVGEPWSGGLIDDLRQELLSSRGLLAAIAGPAITLTAAADGGAWQVRMSGENLIRALVNLVKNSADSMGGAGTIHLHLTERRDAGGDVRSLVLSVEDTGCGIPPEFLEKIFDSGFSTHGSGAPRAGWVSGHRGLGLAITRSIVAAAGGRIHAENRAPQGTCFVIDLPVRNS